MCLITICPAGTSKKKEDLENFIKNGLAGNSDGAGVAIKYADKDGLYYKKGFTEYQEISDYIEGMALNNEDVLMLHYRIGTQGASNAFNTHPFVISQDMSEMCATEGITNMPLVMHNGVFYGDFSGPSSSSYFSDTFYIAHEFLSIPEVLSLLKRDLKQFSRVHKDVIGKNKLAILFPDSNIIRSIGDFIKDGGYYHSNQGYCRTDYKNIGGREVFNYDKEDNKEHQSKNKLNKLLNYNNPLSNYSILPYGETYMPITEYNRALLVFSPIYKTCSSFPKSLLYGKHYIIEAMYNSGKRLHLREEEGTDIISIDNYSELLQRNCTIKVLVGYPKSLEVMDYKRLYNKFIPTKTAILRSCTILSNSYGKEYVTLEGVSYKTAAALMFFHDIKELCKDHRIYDVLVNPKDWIIQSRLGTTMTVL